MMYTKTEEQVLLMKEALDIIEKKIIDLNARIKSHEMQKE